MKILDLVREWPVLARESLRELEGQVRTRQRVIQDGCRPRHLLGWIPLPATRLTDEECLEEVSLLIRDYEALVAELHASQQAYEGSLRRLARAVQGVVEEKIEEVCRLEAERAALHEAAHRKGERGLAEAAAEMQKRLVRTVRLLARATVLILRKLEVCWQSLTQLAEDEAVQRRVLADLVERLDLRRHALHLDQRIGAVEREVEDLAEVAVSFEQHLHEWLGPLQTLIERVARVDERVLLAISEIQTATELALEEQAGDPDGALDDPVLDFLVASRVKQDRLLQILDRATPLEEALREFGAESATGDPAPASVPAAIDRLRALLEKRLVPGSVAPSGPTVEVEWRLVLTDTLDGIDATVRTADGTERHFQLRRGEDEDRLRRFLAETPGVITVLDLGGWREKWRGSIDQAEALRTWPELTRTTALVLPSLDVGRAFRLARARMDGLLSLRFREPGDPTSPLLGPEGASALSQGPFLAHLETLAAPGQRIQSAGAVALVQSPHLGELVRLDLSQDDMGDEGALALARCPSLHRLTHLALAENGIGDQGATALARSPYLGRLASLDLSRNRVGSAGAAALARGACFSLLTSLDLRQNNLCAEGIAALLQSSALGRCKVET
jgi:hypothetical protein